MELVVIGKIYGSHNLNGAMKASFDIDELDSLIGEKIIIETQNGEEKIFTIRKANNTTNNKWIVEFDGIASKEDTTPLRNALIKAHKDFVNVPEYFNKEDELLDMIAYDLVNKEDIGKITSVFSTLAHDILVIEDEKHETLVPNIELFVKEINKEKNTIFIELLDGMREEKKDREKKDREKKANKIKDEKK